LRNLGPVERNHKARGLSFEAINPTDYRVDADADEASEAPTVSHHPDPYEALKYKEVETQIQLLEALTPDRLTRARQRAGIGKDPLAAKAGVAESTIRRFELRRLPISMENRLKLVRYLWPYIAKELAAAIDLPVDLTKNPFADLDFDTSKLGALTPRKRKRRARRIEAFGHLITDAMRERRITMAQAARELSIPCPTLRQYAEGICVPAPERRAHIERWAAGENAQSA
jgi:ribosome-binding protein aMBF1 (putative translation factor)